MHEILLNIESKEIRYAYLKHGQLHDLIIDRKKSRQITGNIYRGRVTNILHNIQSAFIDINEGENGFIHISDILENTKKFEEMFDMDFDLDYDITQNGCDAESERHLPAAENRPARFGPGRQRADRDEGGAPHFEYFDRRTLSRHAAEQPASRRIAQNRRQRKRAKG